MTLKYCQILQHQDRNSLDWQSGFNTIQKQVQFAKVSNLRNFSLCWSLQLSNSGIPIGLNINDYKLKLRDMNSPQAKRQLLWNVAEPGDPYDITKSVIAKIPGDKKIFMGDHIQMICLFQAAEIERLMEYLSDYKLKYKEIQREELDRHSYEVLIKQLTLLNADSDNLKTEVTKLREFIRRQTEELEFERKDNKLVDQSLERKYTQALNELQLLVAKNQQSLAELSTVKVQLKGWKSRYQALDKSRQKQVEQLRGETQRQLYLDKELKQADKRLSEERAQYQLQIQRLKEELDVKNDQIKELQVQLSDSIRFLNQKQREIKDSMILEYQGRESKFRAEIQYLNGLLTNKTMQLQDLSIKYQSVMNLSSHREDRSKQLSSRVAQYEDQISKLNSSLVQLQSRLNDGVGMNYKLEDAQNKIALLSQQITRLEYMNGNRSKELEQAIAKNKKLEYDHESLKREYSTLASRLSSLEKSYHDLTNTQNSLMELTQQNYSLKQASNIQEETNKRLNSQIKRLESQLQLAKRAAMSEFQQQTLKNKLKQAAAQSSNWEIKFVEVQRERNKLNEIAHNLQERLRSQGEERMIKYTEQIDRLSRKLREKNQELLVFQRSIRQLEHYKTKYGDSTNQIQTLRNRLQLLEPVHNRQHQFKIVSLNKQIQSLKKQLKSNDYKTKVVEYESRLTVFSEEIDRLNQKLNIKTHEYDQLEVENQKISVEMEQLNIIAHDLQERLRDSIDSSQLVPLNNKINEYENRIMLLSSENEGLNARILMFSNNNQMLNIEIQNLKKRLISGSEIQKQYQRRLSTLSKQVQRLNIVLKTKITECERLDLQIKQISIRQYEKSRAEIQSKRESLRIADEENKSLLDNIMFLKTQIKNLEQQLRSSTVGLHSLKNQNDSLKRKLGEGETNGKKINELELERDQIRRQLDHKTMETNGLNEQLKNLQSEHERICKEFRLKQFQRLQMMKAKEQNDQRIVQMTKKNEQLKLISRQSSEKIAEKQMNIVRLNNEIEQLSVKIRQTQGLELIQQKLRAEIDRLNTSSVETRSQLRRLTDQNQSLRAQVADASDMKQTLQKKMEVQDSTISKANAENNNLNKKIKKYQSENGDLKAHLSNFKSSEDQISSLRHQLQNINIQKEEYQSRLLTVGNQIERLNGVLRHKIEEKQTAERKSDKLLFELNDHKQKIARLIQQNQTLALKVSQTNSELQRYLNSYNQSDYDLLKKKVRDYEDQTALLSQQILRLQERTLIERHRSQAQISDKLNQSMKQMTNYEDKIMTLTNEIQRLNHILRGKIDVQSRLLSAKNQNERLNTLLQTKTDVQNKASVYLQQIQRLNNTLRLKMQESKEMEEKVVVLQNDTKMERCLHEIERLNDSLRIKVNESKQFQQKCNQLRYELESMRQKYNQAVKQYEIIRRKYLQMEQKFPKLNSQFNNLSQVILSLKQQLAYQKQENYNLSVQLSRDSAQSVEQKNAFLAAEIQRLNRIIRQLQTEIAELRLRYVDENALQKRIKEHLSLFVVLFAQIQSLRRRVKEKEKEVDQVRRSSLAPYIVVPSHT